MFPRYLPYLNRQRSANNGQPFFCQNLPSQLSFSFPATCSISPGSSQMPLHPVHWSISIFWKLLAFSGWPHLGHVMCATFLPAALSSASCFDLSFARSSRSFFTKYSSSCAFFRSSHLSAMSSSYLVSYLL